MSKTEHRFEIRLRKLLLDEGIRTSNSLYTRHFIETTHKFINPFETVEILIVENNINKQNRQQWHHHESL